MTQTSGNVLFLILIAVALFAALSYAVTSSTRTGGGSVSKEKARAYASAIIQNTATIRQGILRVRASGNCTENTLSFKNSVYKGYNGTTWVDVAPYENANAPVNKSCHIFDPAGADVIPTIPPVDSLNMQNATVITPCNGCVKAGHGAAKMEQFKGVGTDGPASTSTDLVFRQYYLNKDTCIALNDLLGVANPSGSPPILDEVATNNGGGTTNSDYNQKNGDFGVSTATLEVTALSGIQSVCYYKASVDIYMFVDTLIAR